MNLPWKPEVAVVGGGLSGLAAATLLARRGARVVLLEQGTSPGGRGITEEKHGFRFNVGPHALYLGGPSQALLAELGVAWTGGDPASVRNEAWYEGRRHPLPSTPAGFLTTSLFDLREKWKAVRMLTQLKRRVPDALDDVPLSHWLAEQAPSPKLTQFFEFLARVTTFTHAPSELSAGAALRQMSHALSGVRYLDGGWQTLVDGLSARAREAGVEIRTRCKVTALEHDGQVRALRLADGSRLEVPAAILCTPPSVAAELTREPTLQAFAHAAVPVRLATLDVALSSLPDPRTLVCFRLDTPVYFSVHSAVAALAPEGKVLFHAAKYLDPLSPSDPAQVQQELEQYVEMLQPGWRDRVEHQRFLPQLTVAPAAALARHGGLRQRPAAAVSGVRGLAVAGDWVGARHMLLDACMASATDAVAAVSQEAQAGRRRAG